MRIAQIAPLTEAVPPKLYGGTERVISWLTEALVELGHDVTLFASGDSVTSAKLEAGWPRALRLDGAVRDANALHMAMLEGVAQRAGEFDLLHFHLDYYPFSLFSRLSTAFVTTLHGRLDLPEHRPVFEAFPKAPVIAISESQRSLLPTAPWAGTVLHGLPEGLLRPTSAEPSYLAFLGRISPEKGLPHAIRVARNSGIPLKIAAKVDRADVDYFNAEIRPLLDQPGIEFIGEISDAEKSEFLSGAVALLTLIDWPEPFGLVMIEAMACGTPVIAFPRGAVPEIIEDGVNGFIVADEKEAVSAVSKLGQLSRARVRARFVERFTSRRMAEDYLHIYAKLVDVVPAHFNLNAMRTRRSRRPFRALHAAANNVSSQT
jgi:glycosyltransferase involved in cell wall biosynthesis